MKEVTVNELEFGECYQIISEGSVPFLEPHSLEHTGYLKNPVFMYLGKTNDKIWAENSLSNYSEVCNVLVMTNSKKGYLHVIIKDEYGDYGGADKIFALSPKNS